MSFEIGLYVSRRALGIDPEIPIFDWQSIVGLDVERFLALNAVRCPSNVLLKCDHDPRNDPILPRSDNDLIFLALSRDVENTVRACLLTSNVYQFLASCKHNVVFPLRDLIDELSWSASGSDAEIFSHVLVELKRFVDLGIVALTE